MTIDKTLAIFVSSISALSIALLGARAPQNVGPPVGTIVAYGGPLPINGDSYLLCDGALVSSSSYPELARVLGRTWGTTSNQNTFRLPDLRGQFLRGVTMSSSIDPDVTDRIPNGSGERNAPGSMQRDAVGRHAHDVRMSFGNPLGNDNFDYVGGPQFRQPPANKVLPTSESGGRETRPTNAYVYYVIRAR